MFSLKHYHNGRWDFVKYHAILQQKCKNKYLYNITWVLRPLKSPAAWLFNSLFRLTTNKTSKLDLHYWHFVSRIHWWPSDSPCKGTVMQKAFPVHNTNVMYPHLWHVGNESDPTWSAWRGQIHGRDSPSSRVIIEMVCCPALEGGSATVQPLATGRRRMEQQISIQQTKILSSSMQVTIGKVC